MLRQGRGHMAAEPLDPREAPDLGYHAAAFGLPVREGRAPWVCLRVQVRRPASPPDTVLIWRDGARVRESRGTDHYVSEAELSEVRYYPVAAWREVWWAWERAAGIRRPLPPLPDTPVDPAAPVRPGEVYARTYDGGKRVRYRVERVERNGEGWHVVVRSLTARSAGCTRAFLADRLLATHERETP